MGTDVPPSPQPLALRERGEDAPGADSPSPLRFWIELGFKAIKSLGWKWDKTRRTDPARV